MVSKTQIDKLGERLKSGAYSDDDLRELDAYRQTFVDTYTLVIGRIRGELGLAPTGRPAKSTTAIVVQRLPSIFPTAEFVDRRLIPSFGYRAVHVIVSHDHALVEIQVRTRRQHQWAELSEKLSDAIALQERDDPDQPDDAMIDSSIETLIALYINRNA